MTTPETAAPAPAGSSGIPVVSDALRVIKAMFSPGDTFGEMNPVKPPFWGAWIFVTIIFMVAQFLMSPFQQKIQRMAMEAAGRPTGNMDAFMLIGMAFTPVITLAMICIAALILWVTVSLTGGESRFRQMMSVNVFSWGPILIQQFIMWGVLQSRGLDAVRSAADLRPALGLDLLLPAETGGFLMGLAAGINPFAIWATVIAAVGLQVLVKLDKSKAWTAAIISFLVSLVIGALIAGMFGGAAAG